MANIQQAAAWMRAGYCVQRAVYAGARWLVPYEPRRESFAVCSADDRRKELTCEDLLADDWELTGE